MTTYLEAIEAKMGDWTYYISKMKFADVIDRVKLAEQIHPAPELDKVIQRDLSERVEGMKDFLLKNPQRFYGALVVAVYGGSPRFHPVKINEGNAIVDSVQNSFGLLAMDGSQQYFALDGQHRVESIKSACAEDPQLVSDEISVIILKHENSEVGLQRTRRLFTKLNRYAKPTKKKDDITIDEDDVVAIITRRLIRDSQNLKGRVKIDGDSLNPKAKTDKSYFTFMGMLYECNKILLNAYDPLITINRKFQATRPKDELIEAMYEYACSIWDHLFAEIEALKRVNEGVFEAGALREGDDGGSVWGRPVFHKIVATVIQRSLKADVTSLPATVDKLKLLPQQLNKAPWNKVIYTPQTNKMSRISNSKISLLSDIACLMLDVSPDQIDEDDVVKTYRVELDGENVELPTIP